MSLADNRVAGAGVSVEFQSGKVDGSTHEVASQLVQPFGIVGIDGGSIMDGKTRVPPRKEEVDTLLRNELALSKEVEDLVPEEEIGLTCVDIRYGNPLPIGRDIGKNMSLE